MGEGTAAAGVVIAELGLRRSPGPPPWRRIGPRKLPASRSRALSTARGPWWSRDSMAWRVTAPSRNTSAAPFGCSSRPKARPRYRPSGYALDSRGFSGRASRRRLSMSRISVRWQGRSPMMTASPAWASSVARSAVRPSSRLGQPADGFGQARVTPGGRGTARRRGSFSGWRGVAARRRPRPASAPPGCPRRSPSPRRSSIPARRCPRPGGRRCRRSSPAPMNRALVSSACHM